MLTWPTPASNPLSRRFTLLDDKRPMYCINQSTKSWARLARQSQRGIYTCAIRKMRPTACPVRMPWHRAHTGICQPKRNKLRSGNWWQPLASPRRIHLAQHFTCLSEAPWGKGLICSAILKTGTRTDCRHAALCDGGCFPFRRVRKEARPSQREGSRKCHSPGSSSLFQCIGQLLL